MRPRDLSSLGLLVVLLATVPVLPAWASGDSGSDVEAVAKQLVCYCGCSGLTAAACTCGTAESIRATIRQQLDSGLTPDQVVQAWVKERGEQILAVPTREGFNLVGWTLPFVVTGLALLALTLILFRRKGLASPADAPVVQEEDLKLLSRIEREVKSLQRPS
ncbi:MAG: cytochrome c-type biogenesis protein CcmH [Acidobacteriota bacterium]